MRQPSRATGCDGSRIDPDSSAFVDGFVPLAACEALVPLALKAIVVVPPSPQAR